MDGQARILLVDDDSAIRDVIAELLEEDGFGVITAANGAEAMAKLDEIKDAPPRLILLDLMMPVMDGWQFLDRYADSELPPVPVVVLSANLAASGGVHRSDVLLYLRKPLDVDRLLETVHTWCD